MASRSSLLWSCLLFCALTAVGLPGCGGCTSGSPQANAEAEKKRKEEEEKKKKEKPKPDFVAGRLMTQPNTLTTLESAAKPGHWTSATVELRANNFDFLGEMVTDPFDLNGMPFRLGTSRPAALPKGQTKHLELVFYIPPGKTSKTVPVRLLTQSGRREVLHEPYPVSRIKAHQFYFLVLARNPERYSFLKVLPSIEPPTTDFDMGEGSTAYYRVLLPPIEKRAPLPSNPLTWTSIAYLLWDDADPTVLTFEQQQALLDWLHWGGQLIVSGPDTLDTLRGSFLDPYLPASGGESLKLTTESFAAISQQWSPAGQELRLKRAWTGRQLRMDPQTPDVQVLAADRGGEPLLIERRIGRGGVVLSSFRLSQRELRDWRSFDNFFNNAILRRQPRAFTRGDADGWSTRHVHWDLPPAPAFDPTRVSAVNYFTRDAAIESGTPLWNWVVKGPSAADEAGAPPVVRPRLVDPAPIDPTSLDTGDGEALIGPGVAGWEDFNAAAEMARQSLRTAAGITIPKADFVVWVLGAYLAVLVPLNWAIFRLLGRVELAWVAAPVITLAFAAAVVRLAQLDIGFARSKTELSVIEFNGTYPRAHVTRYTALYTSLSTSYDLRFDDGSALVQPFPAFSQEEGQALLRGQGRTIVNYRRAPRAGEEGKPGTGITLEGFEVSSNSLGMVHSEHMSDLGGGLELKLAGGQPQVANNTFLTLEGAMAIQAVGQRTDDKTGGGYEIAWMGSIAPGAAATLRFQPATAADFAAIGQATGLEPPLDLRRMQRLAVTQLAPGEIRLVAWSAEEVPGLTIEPAASQSRQTAVIVAHLTHGPRAAPRPDTSPFQPELANTAADETPSDAAAEAPATP